MFHFHAYGRKGHSNDSSSTFIKASEARNMWNSEVGGMAIVPSCSRVGSYQVYISDTVDGLEIQRPTTRHGGETL